ncbi:MAG: methyltransferase domain-containing protein [Myxococcota bacterium]
MATNYIPALRYQRLDRFYDPLVTLLGYGRSFHTRVAELLALQPGEAVLDVGAGTGTLAILLKQRVPSARVVGLDIDPAILEIAGEKARNAGVDVEWKEAPAQDLPFRAQSFDRVVSSLAFHHLRSADKHAAMEEVARVLRPGGMFLLADMGPLQLPGAGVVNRLLAFNVVEQVGDNFAGRIPAMLRAAGFRDVTTAGVFRRHVHLWRAWKPGG